MNKITQVTEYSILTSDGSKTANSMCGLVSQDTLDWLFELNDNWSNRENETTNDILVGHNSKSIKLGSYVGFLQSPTGEQIEILPKTQIDSDQNDIIKGRKLLHKMLASTLKIKNKKQADFASLQRLNTPIHEWIFSEFLSELKKLITSGLRFDYEQHETQRPYISGKLNITKQLRQLPGKANIFNLTQDLYTPNRIENRLIYTALCYVNKLARTPDNWRLSNELKHVMFELKEVHNPMSSMHKWQHNRLMAPYGDIKPWCEIILEKMNPSYQKGKHRGIALLFPMETLFEDYVANCLREKLSSQYSLKSQSRSEYLLGHHQKDSLTPVRWFQLKPDIVITNNCNNSECFVKDTKWKLLDSAKSNGTDKYNIKSNDIYQMLAYGQTYMKGKGHMMLICPSHADFNQPVPVFNYDGKLHLWVVPFDLETDQLICGEWSKHFNFYKTFRKVNSIKAA